LAGERNDLFEIAKDSADMLQPFGDKVIIEKDKQVVLDVTPPALNGVTIDGKLSFGRP
jgi:hypothetical protein